MPIFLNSPNVYLCQICKYVTTYTRLSFKWNFDLSWRTISVENTRSSSASFDQAQTLKVKGTQKPYECLKS